MGTRACRILSIHPVCSRLLSSFLDTVLRRSAFPPLLMDLTDKPSAGLHALAMQIGMHHCYTNEVLKHVVEERQPVVC